MHPQGIGEARPLVDPVAGLGERRLKLRLLHLIDERAQGLDERDARMEQRRELPRHHGDLDGADPAEDCPEVHVPRLLGARHGLFEHLGSQHAVAAQGQTQGLRIVGVLDALDVPTGTVDATPLVDSHG